MKINGELHYLWRAVDHEDEVLESYVTKCRNKHVALSFLKTRCSQGKVMIKHSAPKSIVTDKLLFYGAALKEAGCSNLQITD